MSFDTDRTIHETKQTKAEEFYNAPPAAEKSVAQRDVKVRQSVNQAFEDLANRDLSQMSPAEWEAFSSNKYHELGQIFRSVIARVKTGQMTRVEQEDNFTALKGALRTLQQQNLKFRQLNNSSAALKAHEVKVIAALGKVERSLPLADLYQDYFELSVDLEEKTLRLNDRLELVEVDQSFLCFDEYRQLLEGAKGLAELCDRVNLAESDGAAEGDELKAELLNYLRADLTMMMRGREDFMSEVESLHETALLEAEARFKHAINDSQRQEAWQELRQVDQLYQQAYEAAESIAAEMAALSTPEKPVSLLTSAFTWAGSLASSVLHPLKTLSYDPNADAHLQMRKFKTDLAELAQAAAHDRDYLCTLKENSRRKLLEIHSQNPQAFDLAQPLKHTAAPLSVPLTEAGKKRLEKVEREHAYRAELAKEPDERYRTTLNRLFLAMQVLAGVQWVSQTVPQQVMTLKANAEKLSIQAGLQRLNNELSAVDQAYVEQDLLMIEGMLKGLIKPTPEEFRNLQAENPRLALYMQKISGQAAPPFAKACTEQWVQRQLSEYRHAVVETASPKAAPANPFSQIESAISGWCTDFLQPQAVELVDLASQHGGSAAALSGAIEHQAHLVSEALKWRGAAADNPFLTELRSMGSASSAAWVSQWEGGLLDGEAVAEIRDFYVKMLVNGYQRFIFQSAEASATAASSMPQAAASASASVAFPSAPASLTLEKIGKSVLLPASSAAATIHKDVQQERKRIVEDVSGTYAGWFSGPSPDKRLTNAVKEHNLAEAEKAIQDGVDLNYFWLTPFIVEAAREGYQPIVELMIKNKADVNVRTKTAGWTPLHEALHHGHLEVFKTLIEHGNADVNAYALTKGYAAIHLAAEADNRDFIRYLTALSLEPNSENKPNLDLKTVEKKQTALHLAAMRGDIEASKLLVDAGADLKVVDGSGKQAIHYAIENGSIELVRYLIDKMGKSDTVDNRGNSLLHYAVRQGNAEILREVAGLSAQFDQKNEDGQTPLHIACMAKNIEAVRYLLSLGADVNSIDKQGRSPLHSAVEAKDINALRLLTEQHADLNMQDTDGKTVFLKAVQNNLSDIVDFLRQQRLDLDLADQTGISPLVQAILSDNLELARELAIAKAGIHASYQGGAAHLAADRHMYDLAIFLVDQGVDPNMQDGEGLTVLSKLLISEQPLETIKKIVASGADVNLPDNNGLLPIVYAGHDLKSCKTIEFLLESGTRINYINARNAQTPKLMLLSRAKNAEERACAARLGEDKYADEFLFRKLLTHAWDLTGSSQIGEHTFQYEGVFKWGQSFFAKKMQESIETFSQTSPGAISSALKSSLQDTLEASTNFDLDQTWDRFQQGLPVLIHTGFSGHAMNIVLIGSYMVICNRGALSSAPVEAYLIDREKITKENLQTMMKAQEMNVVQAALYYKLFLGTGSKPRQDEVTKLLTQHNNMLSYQTVGNCAWESMEAAMLMLFLMAQILDNRDNSAPLDANVVETIARFDDWIKNTELAFLEDYLAKHEQPAQAADIPMDEALLDAVFAKAGSVLNERLENFQKYERVAQEKLAAAADYQARLETLKEHFIQLKFSSST